MGRASNRPSDCEGCHRKSGLPDLRHSIVRSSGQPEFRGGPRLSCNWPRQGAVIASRRRSNPGAVAPLDCFVAYAPRNDGRDSRTCMRGSTRAAAVAAARTRMTNLLRRMRRHQNAKPGAEANIPAGRKSPDCAMDATVLPARQLTDKIARPRRACACRGKISIALEMQRVAPSKKNVRRAIGRKRNPRQSYQRRETLTCHACNWPWKGAVIASDGPLRSR